MVKMPPTKLPRKETKEEKQANAIDLELSKLRPTDEKVDDEQAATLLMMEMIIPLDIEYRRGKNLPDLLLKKEINEVLEGLQSDDNLIRKEVINKYGFIYNVKLISMMKSKELEIKNGKKCKSCGRMTSRMRNVQLRAGDEGTGRVLQCTNPKCNAVRKIDSG